LAALEAGCHLLLWNWKPRQHRGGCWRGFGAVASTG